MNRLPDWNASMKIALGIRREPQLSTSMQKIQESYIDRFQPIITVKVTLEELSEELLLLQKISLVYWICGLSNMITP